MRLEDDFWDWQREDSPTQYLLGLSGGVDSMVLLHLLAGVQARLSAPLFACFLDHGWHDDAPQWAAHCAQACAALAVPFFSARLRYDDDAGGGPEAQARAARYRAFAAHLPAGGVLLTAHHQDDQAETLLLQLLRGSGLAGLAAMPARKAFARGAHWRPLLGCTRQAIVAYARQQQIAYIDDPSNAETRYARNRLRHECMTVLNAAFPAVTQQMARSAQWLAEAQSVLDDALDAYLPAHRFAPLPWAVLTARNVAWQKALLRRWLSRAGCAPPPQARLAEFLRQCRSGATGAELRYGDTLLLSYREHIHTYRLSEPTPPPPFAAHTQWLGVGEIILDDGAALLAGRACRWALYPPGGRWQGAGRAHSKALKDLFQQAGVPPYIRRRTPLLWVDDTLVWVGGLGAAEGWSGLSLRWQNRAYSANIAGDL